MRRFSLFFKVSKKTSKKMKSTKRRIAKFGAESKKEVGWFIENKAFYGRKTSKNRHFLSFIQWCKNELKMKELNESLSSQTLFAQTLSAQTISLPAISPPTIYPHTPSSQTITIATQTLSQQFIPLEIWLKNHLVTPTVIVWSFRM